MTDDPTAEDPGPIWEHLPIEDPGLPRRESGVAPPLPASAFDDMPAVRLHLREIFAAKRSRFLVALVLNVLAGWFAWQAPRVAAKTESVGNTIFVASPVLVGAVGAIALVVIAGADLVRNARTWLRVAGTGAIVGSAYVLLSVPEMVADDRWVSLAAAPLLIIAGLYIEIRWGLAPLIAFHERVAGVRALRIASRAMRGHGFAAFFLLVLLGAVDLAVVIAVAVAGGTDGLFDSRVGFLLSLTSGFTLTLWMSWLGSLHRRLQSGRPSPN